MIHEFGDIDLFHVAISQDRLDPPIDKYLASTGMSKSEIEEVRDLFKQFCAAIENSQTQPLPDVASGPRSVSQFKQTSAN